MLKVILILIATAAVVFLIIVGLQPADFHITRTATVSAPPSMVFERVNDLRQWQAWSPYEKLDPEAKKTYEGPNSGVGASFSWTGNSRAGAGRLTITESHPSEVLRMRLEMFKPFAAVNDVEFTFRTEGDWTAVTWKMSGRNGFLGKAFGLIMNMDKVIGKEFETGLSNLNAVVKSAPATTQH